MQINHFCWLLLNVCKGKKTTTLLHSAVYEQGVCKVAHDTRVAKVLERARKAGMAKDFFRGEEN